MDESHRQPERFATSRRLASFIPATLREPCLDNGLEEPDCKSVSRRARSQPDGWGRIEAGDKCNETQKRLVQNVSSTRRQVARFRLSI
jgi:hypothetical protein